MQDQGAAEVIRQTVQRVAIFGEHDRGFTAKPMQEAADVPLLRIRRRVRRGGQPRQPTMLAPRILEPGRRQRRARFVVVIGQLVVEQRHLAGDGRPRVQQRDAPVERSRERFRRRQRALAEHRHRQPRALVVRRDPDLSRVALEQPLQTPLRGGDRDGGEAMTACSRQADVLARPPEDQRRVVRGRAEPHQRGERGAVPGEWRRSDQDHDARARGDALQSRVAVGRRRCRVRFVDDQRVPRVRRHGVQNVGALQKVDRRDVDAGQRPGRDVRGQIREGAAKPRRVRQDRVQTEVRRELRLPLPPQPCRHRDQHAAVRAPLPGIGDDPSGLDGLAETDFVGEQDPARAIGDRERRRELRRDHARAQRTRSQTVDADVVQRKGHPAPELAQRHHPQPWGVLAAHNPVERPEQYARMPGPAVLQVQRRAVFVRDDGVDQPFGAADDDLGAWHDAG